MAQSVSNDALWEKLSEVDKKLEKLSEMQKPSNLSDEQAVIKPDFQKGKDEIVTEIQEQTYKLGKHGDINFGAVNQNIKVLDEHIRKGLSIVARIRKQQREAVEPPKDYKKSHFDFKLFKVRKSSFVIVVLGLLVFILTLFCMKQQNDYLLLMNEYHRQSIVIKEIQTEVDSLSTAVQKPELVKKRQ